MIEHTAVLPSKSNTAVGSAVLPNISTSAFIGMAQAQTEEARTGLQAYLAGITEEAGLLPFATTLTPLNDHATLTMGLQCAYSGSMTPAQYQALHAQLEQALASHPVLGPYKPTIACEHKADGQVTLTANVVGLTTHDYAHLIQSLAEHQHAQDNHETTTGERREDAHDTHEKMLAARVKVPEKDLMMQGFADRDKARPAMGALTRAFHRKRRGVTPSFVAQHTDPADDHAPETLLHVDEHHVHAENQHIKDSPLAVLAGSRVHMGVVHDLAQQAVLGSN
jgi:hypothetical protein